MTSYEIPFKFKTRLNKSDSEDYQNIPPTEIQEAINKALLEITRKTLHGANLFQEGREDSKTRISDFQTLIRTKKISGINKDVYFQSTKIPDDFFEHLEVTGIVDKGTCISVRIPSSLIEVANVNVYLADGDKQPSFDFEQSFHILQENKIKLYHNNDFEVKEIELNYYKSPQYIQIPGAFLVGGGIGKDMKCELKDDLMEIVIDEAVRIKAADIESLNRMTTAEKSVDKNI